MKCDCNAYPISDKMVSLLREKPRSVLELAGLLYGEASSTRLAECYIGRVRKNISRMRRRARYAETYPKFCRETKRYFVDS